MSSSTVTNTGTSQLVAFFRDREDAYEAIDELRSSGFTNSEIGLAFQGDSSDYSGERTANAAHSDKSTWQKIKDFFTGGDEDNDTAYSGGDMDTGYRHFNFSDEQWQYYRSGI